MTKRIHKMTVQCTGLTAFWCPRCGECTCRRDSAGERCFDDFACPLHSVSSSHADNQELVAAELLPGWETLRDETNVGGDVSTYCTICNGETDEPHTNEDCFQEGKRQGAIESGADRLGLVETLRDGIAPRDRFLEELEDCAAVAEWSKRFSGSRLLRHMVKVLRKELR